MNESEGDVLTTVQAAKILGASVGAVNKWIDEGDFPNAYRLNPSRPKSPWRIPKGDIELFIKKRTQERGYFYVPVQPGDQVQKRETKTEVPPGDDTDEEQAKDELVQLELIGQ